ncbi:TraR/DksA family transcriptional regulator [Streptomyces sp. NPDC015220]|uniref:TraR/DksA family transcriptional regulator n=1 Tax=Streptomyces sp. NPDC015220 TaxID=3364947 RepID=UPI0037013374
MSPEKARTASAAPAPASAPAPVASRAAGRPGAHEVRQRLEHERNSRLAQSRALREAEEAGREADELLTAQRDAVRRALEDIEAAFARLDDGTYGDCRDCGRPIPVEWLAIPPYARSCVPCRQRTG